MQYNNNLELFMDLVLELQWVEVTPEGASTRSWVYIANATDFEVIDGLLAACPSLPLQAVACQEAKIARLEADFEIAKAAHLARQARLSEISEEHEDAELVFQTSKSRMMHRHADYRFDLEILKVFVLLSEKI